MTTETIPMPRPELADVPPVPHGGYHHTQSTPAALDFSANINPFGPSPHVWPAMQSVVLEQHPDPRATPLRAALATLHNVALEAVLVGNGAVDLIYQIAVAYVRPHDAVMIITPTFGEYAAAAAMMGARIITHPLSQATPTAPFTLDLDALIAAVQHNQPRLLFWCNPNNPTGTYVAAESVERVLQAAPATLLVLDEAFVNFVAEAWPATALLDYPNLLILRSMTKDYALTGLRLGYLLAAPAVVDALLTVQPPWSVNALAQAAGLAALADQQHLRTTLAALAYANQQLRAMLDDLHFEPLASAVHFWLLPVPTATAPVWQRALLAHGVRVRDTSSFGLPVHVRIAAQAPAANARLVMALQACREELCAAKC